MANHRRSSRPFFQEIIDLRAQGSNKTLERLEAAARALERKDVLAARDPINELISSKPKDEPVIHISDEFFYQFMARLLFLDAPELFRAVFDWWTPFKWPTAAFGKLFDRLEFVWDEIVEIAISHQFRLKGNTFESHFTILMRTLRELLVDYAKTQEAKDFKKGDAAKLSRVLLKLFKKLILQFHHLFQDRLDRSVDALTRGRGEKSLALLQKRFQALKKLLLSSKAGQRLLSFQIETTKISHKFFKGRYLDFFAPAKGTQKRSIEYTLYDPDGDADPLSRQIDIGLTLMQREQQFSFLTYLFGFAKDDQGKAIQESKQIGAALKNLNGRFSIHDNDDWARILAVVFRQRFTRLRAGSKTEKQAASEAWIWSAQLFKKYLATFTEHAKFNIRDSGKNYLDTTFPRTLAARELHDCGVYAVRICYVLSRFSQLVDKGLKAPIRINPASHFVRLPQHVGLIIEIFSKDALIFHNKDGWPLRAGQRAELEERWKNTRANGEPRSGGPISLNAEVFWAEVSAGLFIQHVDQPALVIDVVTAARTSKRLRAQIWRTYLKQVVMDKGQLFSTRVNKQGDPAYRFNLRYLQLLEQTRKWYNQAVVPFWNIQAHQAWQAHAKNLNTRLRAFKSASPDQQVVAAQRFIAARDNYLAELTAGRLTKGRRRRIGGLVRVREQEIPLGEIRKQISDGLDQFPDVLKKGVIRTSHLRMNIAHGRLEDVFDHMKAITKHPSKLQALPVPPFANKDDRLEIIPE